MADKKPAKKVVKKVPTSKKTTTKTKKKAVVKKKTVAKKIAPKAITIREKSDEMGLWSRFWRVFTPTFLSKLVAQKSQGKSWGFWFLSNLLLILVPFIVCIIIFNVFLLKEFPNNLVEKIPNNQEIVLDNGEVYNVKTLINDFQLSLDAEGILSSENMPDPLVVSGKFNNDETVDNILFHTNLESIDDNLSNGIFVFDTKDILDVRNLSKKFENYVYILDDEMIIFDGQENKYQTIIYKELIENTEVSEFPKTLSYNDLIVVKPFIRAFGIGMLIIFSIFLYLFLAVARLLNALIWSLIFWAVGAIFGIKNWGFEESFTAMLHFSFVTMLLVPLAFIFDIKVWLYALIVLALLFGMNFWEMKRK